MLILPLFFFSLTAVRWLASSAANSTVPFASYLEKIPSSSSCSVTACIPVARKGGKWIETHEQLKLEADSVVENNKVIFFGDSITEFLRGTYLGRPQQALLKNKQVFEQDIVSKFGGALALGISGDETQHLLWRLQNGELPDGLKLKSDVVVVLHIGTNNLSGNQEVEHIAQGVIACIESVLKALSDATVILLGILPRRQRVATEQINALLRHHIEEINNHLQHYVDTKSSSRLIYLDCGSLFLMKDERAMNLDTYEIDKSLMQDFLHPTAKGYHNLFTTCLGPELEKHLIE